MEKREHKYRAWDIEAEKMLYPENISDDYIFHFYLSEIKLFRENATWKERGGESNEEDVYEECDAVLLEFTGLKDKNGKRIFEGDILKAFAEDEYGHNRVDYVLPVVYHEELGCFGFPVTSIGESKSPLEDYKNFLWQLDGLEIIGNIFENPDLLSPTK